MKPDLFQAPDYYNINELLNDEHRLVRDAAREWVKREVSPIIEDYAQRAEFPTQIIKGLGEISPDEFVHFIGNDIRLDPVMLDKSMSIEELLSFYMGKNTPDRQEFIIENLKVELDRVEE